MKKKVAWCMVLVMLVSLFSMGEMNVTAAADAYPYVMFAASDEDGAISVTANDICINGAVATNGTAKVTGRANLNGKIKEQAGMPAMIAPDRLYDAYFAGDNVLVYEDAITLENPNNLNNPVMGYDNVIIKGNVNLNNAVWADLDLSIEGDMLNGNGSMLVAFEGDIRIKANNVNLNGLIYAPFGKVVIDAQYVNMNQVIVVADSVEIKARSVNMNYGWSAATLLGSKTEYTKEDFGMDADSFLGEEDRDGDGLTEVEELFFETDPLLTDTDGDGLTDYEEAYLSGTEPLVYDSVQAGVSDAESDIDGDGLNNKKELMLGTNPCSKDTDLDGLTDDEELNVYGTDPLLADTDGDGAVDGWEIENGYNPLVFDAQFVIKTEVTTDMSHVAAEITTDGGSMGAFELQEVTGHVLFDGELFGYIGRPVELLSDGEGFTGNITFTYEDDWDEEYFRPQIYVFRPDDQRMIPLDTKINNGVASANVTQSGIYALINSAEFELLLNGAYDMASFAGGNQDIDSNGDGISDYDTRVLCNGVVLNNGLFAYPFGDYSYELIQSNSDLDGDGLLNGEEVVITKTSTGTSYTMYSFPMVTDSDFDGINDIDEKSAGDRLNNSFSAKLHCVPDKKSYEFNVSFTVNYELFFRDNTVYNKDLAVLASMFSTDMYEEGYIDVTTPKLGSTKETTSKPNGVAMCEMFGLKDVRNYGDDDFKKAAKYAGNTDFDDASEFVIGHREVTYLDQTKDIIVIAFRGTNGTMEGWSSNFDVGANTTRYTIMTGAHPSWRNKSNHKGFDVAAQRALGMITQYMLETGVYNTPNEKAVFITGHSRGAAIANIVGAEFQENFPFKTFVYTFATPYTTTAATARTNYNSIFNIINTDDVVTYLPLEQWGFKRYGIDKSISVEDKYEKAGNSKSFEGLIGKDYDKNGQLGNIMEKFNALAQTREDMYIFDEHHRLQKYGYLRKSKALEKYNDYKEELMDEKLLRWCNYSLEEDDDRWYMRVDYGTAFFMQIIANMASGADPKLTGRDVEGKYKEAKRAFIWGSGKILWVGGMEHPHMMPTYYLIVRNNFEAIK